ncbi:HD domain-containing protein [Brachyspira aalborgi]|uniref:HD domain-containing protein n=1 Tax=Brachyspira aalborgi TaxID=29522 RepID=A0A5C8CBR5_9SPIR|nr:HD domain-containing protein [Brachyspira aalborgi]TXJ11084.1 HD domain-containing protein [Brachyspira aalborgi]
MFDLTNNILNIERAEYELNKAYKSNPTAWTEHSKYVAKACRIIAEKCEDLDEEKAYIYGLLHDIGRYAGITSEKHLIDGYKYCINYGWEKLAQICISHAFMIQDIETAIGEFDMSEEDYNFIKEFIKNAKYDDYDLLIQLCDSLAMTNGFCILEKRFIDVAIRYGTFKHSSLRWKKIFDIKKYFENKIGISIYKLLPNIRESIFY